MDELFFFGPLYRELERVQRDFAPFHGGSSSIRAGRPGSFPAINVGSTDHSIEIIAFVPGIDPARVELTIDKGMLTLSGERTPAPVGDEAKAHTTERFGGIFRRVVELPEFADPTKVEAHYSQGCLTISVAKKELSTPKQITIQ